MTIESTLESIDASLKSLLVIAMSAGNATAEFGKPEVAATKTRAKKADVAATVTEAAAVGTDVLAGDPAGTLYFVIEAHNTVYAQKPGEPTCSFPGAVQVTAAAYTERKAEFAKKSLTGATAAPATALVQASETVATVSPASSGASVVTFKQVVDALTLLSKDTRPGKGRDAIVAFVGKHGVAKVPGLEALGKHAELLAEVEALLAVDAVDEDVFA